MLLLKESSKQEGRAKKNRKSFNVANERKVPTIWKMEIEEQLYP